MFSHAFNNCQEIWVQEFMDRSVALGATSGSVSALLLRFISEAFSDPIAQCPLCPEHLDLLQQLSWGGLDLPSLLVGLGLGLALGPVLDLISLVRQSWKVWLAGKWQQLEPERAPLYKLA